jgi:hypothetical protein
MAASGMNELSYCRINLISLYSLVPESCLTALPFVGNAFKEPIENNP